MKTAICVALAFAGIAAAQTNPKDIDGWGKIKWGMTVAQAKAAYGPEAHESAGTDTEHGYAKKLAFEGLRIVGDLELRGSVQTATVPSDQIKEVTLSILESNATAKGGATVRRKAYNTLTDVLIQKYGTPAYRDEHQSRDGGPTTFSTTWILPSTVIRLDRFEAGGSTEYGTLDLRYTATDKKTLDML